MVTRRIDVSGSPELLRVAREVAESGVEVVLSEGGREMVLVTASDQDDARNLTPEEAARRKQALLDAFGSWGDFDGDEFLVYIYAARDEPIERRYWDPYVSG